MNTQLNFDIPASNKVRDAADFAKPFSEVEKIDLRDINVSLASNYVASVPVTYSYQRQTSSTGSVFHINEPEQVSSPDVDARGGVMRLMTYGGRFLYAHSNAGFAPIKGLYVGSEFTATIDGVTSRYRVNRRYVFNKASELDGSANNARRLRIYVGKDEEGNMHSLSLMTCGNGSNNDSAYRLVLYADKI